MTDIRQETATQPNTPDETLDLGYLKQLYTEARDNTRDATKESDLCFDYYDNKQWTSAQIKVLRDRKQPEIWVNRIAPAVNGILGVLEQGASDPRAFPRNDPDEDAAEVATDALRYAADKSRWQRKKLDAAKNCIIGGIAAIIVEVNEDGDPSPRLIRHGEFLYDPHSREKDFSDARYMGVAKWMYVDALKAIYPEADIDPEAIAPASVTFDDEDKPLSVWSDPKRKRVLVVELYMHQKGWRRIVFYGGAILEQGDSPYLDEKKRPTNPIVAQSALVDRDNARYGLVKAMIPIQDEINMRRSRHLHMVNSRQVRQTDENAPQTDANLVRREAARPDGILPFGFEYASLGDLAEGQFQLMNEAKAELERLGPNPAVLGRVDMDASGRAQLVRQQAGMVELTYILGSIEDMELRVFRAMWERIKQFWNAPKMIRVTDDIGAPKFLMINEPVHQQVPAIVPHPQTGQPMAGVQNVQVGMKNRPAEMDMDIIIDASPNTANLEAEQFAELMKLVPIYGPQAFPLEVVIKASSLPKKRDLLDQLDQIKEQAQGPNPVQQLQEQQAAADLRKTSAEADLAEARAHRELATVANPPQQQPEPQDPLAPYKANVEMEKGRNLAARTSLDAAKTHNELLKPHFEAARLAIDEERAKRPAAGG